LLELLQFFRLLSELRMQINEYFFNYQNLYSSFLKRICYYFKQQLFAQSFFPFLKHKKLS